MNNTSSLLPQKILNILTEILPMGAALHEPHFKGNEWNYLKSCLDSGYVSSVGSYVTQFEKDLAAFTGVKRAIAVCNGTSALDMCLKLAGVQPNDEVLIPALTFVATANAVAYSNAIPHFVDSDEISLGVDPQKLNQYLSETTILREGQCFNRSTHRRIRALVVMHTFGHPSDLDPLVEICERFQIQLIEDAAESLGSYYKDKHTGQWGVLSAVSFNGNKTITTGGGGAILTQNEKLADLAKHLTTTAKIPHAWEFVHDQVGYNYRMPNLNAALGCAQIEKLPEFLNKKRALATRYLEAFKDIPGVKAFREPSYAKSNYWLNALILDSTYSHQRDLILQMTNQNKIMTRPVWNLMNTLTMYKNCPKMDLSCAESLARRVICIPSSVFL